MNITFTSTTTFVACTHRTESTTRSRHILGVSAQNGKLIFLLLLAGWATPQKANKRHCRKDEFDGRSYILKTHNIVYWHRDFRYRNADSWIKRKTTSGYHAERGTTIVLVCLEVFVVFFSWRFCLTRVCLVTLLIPTTTNTHQLKQTNCHACAVEAIRPCLYIQQNHTTNTNAET